MKTRLIALTLALATALSTFAGAPTGTFTYDLGVSNTPLWDLSGPLTLQQQIIGVAGQGIVLAVPVTLDQNNKGRVAGAGFTTITVDTNAVTARYTAEGKLFTAGNRTKLKLNVRATGRDVIAGVTNTFKIVLVYQLEVDAATNILTGAVHGTAKFSTLRGGKIDQDVVVPLPEDNDGRWTLTLNLTSATPPGGNAAITLPNGRFLQYAVRGSYKSSTDTTVLSLSGFGTSVGSKFSVRLLSTNAIITDLRGRALGQKLSTATQQTPTPAATTAPVD